MTALIVVAVLAAGTLVACLTGSASAKGKRARDGGVANLWLNA
jgi:hypothetical protein